MSLSKLEQDILKYLREQGDRSYTADDIAKHFNFQGTKNYKRLVKSLAFLERIGEIQLTPQGKFRAFSRTDVVTGTFRANDRGFGFIHYDDEASDLFVPAKYVGSAMEGDTVEATIMKQVDVSTGKGSEAKVERVVERAASQLIGEFIAYDKEKRETTGFVGEIKPQSGTQDDLIIQILPEGIHPAAHSICIVKIKDYPTEEHPKALTGLVSKEIGHKDAPGVDILAILYKFGIPHQFPEEVMKAASDIPQEIESDSLEGRHDLREQLIITIDGADAKDLDDAISVSKHEDGTYQLGVHIADVTHYVKNNSPIDLEARERGTSVYLTDRVVPMLPQRLSNGICSLLPNEDRLTVTCDMRINHQGEVISHEIYLSVINSTYRMTYDDVNAIIDGDEALRTNYQEIVPTLETMADLHHVLEKMRYDRGALNFDAPESKIIVDEDGFPIDIELRERFVGERMIESFMLMANETVAHDFTLRQLPFIFRIHEQPKEERMQRFAEFVTAFGIVLRGDVSSINPKQLQAALKTVEGQPIEQVVSTMMLRSMQQAKYSEEPIGHYGLAAEDYTHFTSPIRRYPDLMVHRLIHLYLKGKPSNKIIDQLELQLPEIAIHSSQMERRAVDAERETDALKKAEYMQDKVGEEFEAMISSITSFGIFVALPNTVEGLITLQSLTDDYYVFNQQHLMLIGERTGKVYRIGQKVTVQLTNVDVEAREIDFQLLDAEEVEGSEIDHIRKQQKQQQKRQPNNRKGKRPAAKGKDERQFTPPSKGRSKTKSHAGKSSKPKQVKTGNNKFKIRKRGK